MGKLTREILSKRMFSDPKHYPYGFGRSGDFSISESKMLQQHGSLIAALVDGELSPENEEEHGYLEAAFGHREPVTSAEKAWVKYQKRINRPKTASIYGSTKPDDVDSDNDVVDDDSPIEIGLDDD
ncbi:DUF413 domain-containing protein [Alteromonas antoniana]|uniref:DUF413 domain-containing protein n=1 Tax=Alteromonas antoniana TaxID=2803813 RepID=UPI001C484D7B|nr:DUF413 domain-containing protein [Alteromonas antoniana]